MTEHIDWEGFLRFEIYTKYICTDHFQSFLSGATERTGFNRLNALTRDGIIEKVSQGQYKKRRG